MALVEMDFMNGSGGGKTYFCTNSMGGTFSVSSNDGLDYHTEGSSTGYTQALFFEDDNFSLSSSASSYSTTFTLKKNCDFTDIYYGTPTKTSKSAGSSVVVDMSYHQVMIEF